MFRTYMLAIRHAIEDSLDEIRRRVSQLASTVDALEDRVRRLPGGRR